MFKSSRAYSSFMADYLVTRCSRCKMPFYFKTPQKTKRCPNCNTLLTLSKLSILYKAVNAEDALKIVLMLKQPGANSSFIEASKIMNGDET